MHDSSSDTFQVDKTQELCLVSRRHTAPAFPLSGPQFASASHSTNKDVLRRPEFPGQRSAVSNSLPVELRAPDIVKR